MSDEVKIPISLPGAGQAAQDAAKVAASLQGIGKATADAGQSIDAGKKAAGGLSEELQNLGSRNNAAKDVIEGVDQASRGGADGLFGLAKSAKNLWEILSAATPLGRVVQLVALAGAAFLALREKIFGAAEAEKAIAEETERAKKKLEEFSATAAALSVERFENFKSNVEGLTEKFADLRSEIDLVQAAADKLDNAELAAALAENKVMPGLTEGERTANEASIRGRFAEQKRVRDEGIRQSKENLAAEELKTKERLESEAAARYQQQLGVVDTNRQRVADHERMQEELRRQLKDTPVAFTRPDPNRERGSISEVNPVYTALQRQLDDVTARLAQFTSDPAQAHAAAAQRELESRKAAFAFATEQANSAYGNLRGVQRVNTIERDTEEKLRLPEFRRRYAERYNDVADTRSEPDPVYKSETRVVDAASLREAAAAEGRKTGAEIARAMQEAIRANNEELLNQVKAARR